MTANQREFRLSLIRSNAGSQTPDDLNETRFTILRSRVSTLAEGYVNIRFSRQLKARRDNANDTIRFAVECEVFADCRPIRSESALPQTVANDGNRRCARPIFVRPETAAAPGNNTQNGEEFWRGLPAFHILWV